MATQIYKNPLTVSVDASNWYLYSFGIYSDPVGTTSYSINHDSNLVGYYPGEYWLVKNSWGVNFGMNGYIRLSTANNTCGMCILEPVWVQ